MQENEALKEQLNRYVEYTLDSGVQPITTLLEPIYDCYNGNTVAFRAVVLVNSIFTGVLEPNDYINGCADEKTAQEMTFRAIKKTLLAQKALEEGNVSFKKIFVPCSFAIASAVDLYATLKRLQAECGCGEKKNKVCLEFDGCVTEEEGTRLNECFSSIRAAGFSVAVNGYGGEGFSVEKLLTVCPDYLFCANDLAPLSVDREKRAAIAPLLNFAKSLGAAIVACGVSSDDELREFRSRDCFAFLPSGSNTLSLDVKRERTEIEDVVRSGGEHD